MTNQFQYIAKTILAVLFVAFATQNLCALQDGLVVKGTVLESVSGAPVPQVVISVASTGQTFVSDSAGQFQVTVFSPADELIFVLPGYVKRSVFINGRSNLVVAMVPAQYKSSDNLYNNPYGAKPANEAVFPTSVVYAADLEATPANGFTNALSGKAAGLQIIEHSGMPGHQSWLGIRGINSLYCNTQPLLFIDGMLHEYNYANTGLMDGFSLNPMDVIDIEDIVDVTVVKNGEIYFGAASSNGVININTEQKTEASTDIRFTGYTGIGASPKALDIMNASDYRKYLGNRLSENYSAAEINAAYPWLNGGTSAPGYYKYNNSTDWQTEIFKPGMLSKGRLYLKGGDDIATYNISAGYLKHDGLYQNTEYSRFNLRINGKINISDRFSVIPNVKIALADSYLPNMGYNDFKNPLLSAALMPPIMAPNARNESGKELPYLDDTGVFNVSNPRAITDNAVGNNRNYHFLSSVNAQYKFGDHITLSNLIGINYNNARENIFLPDRGIVQIDSVKNSPQDFVYEMRSLQNHTTLTYKNKSNRGHSITVNAGLRYIENLYKNVQVIDLNTGSDDIKKLGSGNELYRYLRTTTGDDRGLLNLACFANMNYSIQSKYFLYANASYEGNSAVNTKNRYAFLPSVGAAWRLSSEDFMAPQTLFDDVKLRASWSLLGNMYSNVYDFSKLYYIEKRYNSYGVLIREAIPNEDLELEKKSTINVGVDLAMLRKRTNVQIDFYTSTVNNLIIEQQLPSSYGYTRYFDNGGKLTSTGIELAFDHTAYAGSVVFTLGATITKQSSKITELNFINPNTTKIVTAVNGAEYVTSVNNPVNAFYGYKTNGIFASNSEANSYTGPKGNVMQAGDIRFFDADGNKRIDNADKTIIGDPNPDLFGGIMGSAAYGRFKLLANFTYSIGNDVYNYVKYRTEAMDSYYNQSKAVLNSWTSTNTATEMPRAAIGDPSGNSVFSDRWIEDGSYVRLKQLTLSYKLPSTVYYRGITMYVTATNLLTLTGYTGYDPEFMYSNSPFYMGIDYGAMPQTRSYIVGLVLDL